MAELIKARDARDVETLAAWALAHDRSLELIGHGSKREAGRPAQTDTTVDLSGLTGVTLYEPQELVLSARAGTPVAEIEGLVAAHGQELAFEPIDCGPLLGQPAGAGTLGGILATNLAGPRRIKAGAARDHFLGVEAVSGRGETFKSGGRVVKNVTGYDLCKLLAGSWGTLAIMTEVTVKVLPRAETEATVIVRGSDDATAGRVMARAMGSAGEVSGAAHLPATIASRLPEVAGLGSITALRLEGVEPSIRHRQQLLETMLKGFGQLDVLGETASRRFWHAIRNVTPMASPEALARPLWRISTAPMQGPALALGLAKRLEAEVLYDWAGGLVWLLTGATADGGARLIRDALRSHGGHATLMRGSAALRASIDVFDPLDGPLAALVRRVKDSFDPRHVLNPGRMYAGI